MIERYNVPQISDIWADNNKFKTYLAVELALTEALEGNRIPEGITSTIKAKAKIDPARIKEIEKTTKHDVIAFTTSITENLPEEISKYFHFGCTSSDIIDTATTLQIKKSVELIQKQLKKLTGSLLTQAENNKHILCMGRSHGMNAEPMSFGSKFLSFYAEFSRRLKEIESFLEWELTGQFSGAVGNYTILTPEIEKKALGILGLRVEPISSQVIPRDRITKIISITAMIADAIERLATEVRHLHHSDIAEVFEGFSSGQKGSSIMPHKKNPISCENLTGIARIIRSHQVVAHENVSLWHERDISHSSAERIMLPDNFGLTFYALRRMTETIENLVINFDHIQNKVFKQYNYISSHVMHKLIEENDFSREEIYKHVQAASFASSNCEEFRQKLEASPVGKKSNLSYLSALDESELKKIYLQHIDTIFERVKSSYQKKSPDNKPGD